MMKAVVVGSYRGTIELLQRRIGGILKDIARVDTCWFDKIDETDADIYFSYSEGVRLKILQEKFKNTNKIVIGAELTLLPTGVRNLNALPKGCRLAVLSEHLSCANRFLSEIIFAGVTEYYFQAISFKEMPGAEADYYVVPEDLSDLIKEAGKKKKIIFVPRTVTPACAASIIKKTMAKA
jgi:hypothetical protein